MKYKITFKGLDELTIQETVKAFMHGEAYKKAEPGDVLDWTGMTDDENEYIIYSKHEKDEHGYNAQLFLSVDFKHKTVSKWGYLGDPGSDYAEFTMEELKFFDTHDFEFDMTYEIAIEEGRFPYRDIGGWV